MTFISIIFSLTVVLLFIPLLTSLLHLQGNEDPYIHHSVNHFFYLVRNEFFKAKEAEVVNNTLYIKNSNNELITISQHKKVIRKQVNKKGHEIFLRDVKSFKIKKYAFGFLIQVEMLTGDQFEKSFSLYE